MASLTQSAIISRKLVRWGLYVFILMLIGKTLIDASVAVFRHYFPKAPPPPTLAFGKLPKIPFPEKERPQNLTFKLETPDGSLPQFSTQAKVYFMPSLSSHLFSLETAKQKAFELGFDPNGEEVSQTVYRFRNAISPSVLEMNIVTGIFSISYDLKKDPSPLNARPSASSVAETKIRSYLGEAGLLPKDLTGRSAGEYLSVQGGKLLPAISLSDAQLVKVNLYRKEIDKLPSLTANPEEANVWFIMSGAKEKEKQFLAGEYHYYTIDEDKSATYLIKTSAQAWEELQKGGGFIASLGANEQGNIVIRRVYMAYFDPENPTQFYQPIIVFEGDRGFTAYVPAIASQYYGE